MDAHYSHGSLQFNRLYGKASLDVFLPNHRNTAHDSGPSTAFTGSRNDTLRYPKDGSIFWESIMAHFIYSYSRYDFGCS